MLLKFSLKKFQGLAEYGAPKKLPVTLKTLKTLHLSDMYFEKIDEISCALCLIRSSPSLQKLEITVSHYPTLLFGFLWSKNRLMK